MGELEDKRGKLKGRSDTLRQESSRGRLGDSTFFRLLNLAFQVLMMMMIMMMMMTRRFESI